MPRRLGFERTTIHTAELAGIVSALRWRQLNRWNLLVADRSALFQAMKRVRNGPRSALMKGVCLPLEMRLKHMIDQLRSNWRGDSPPPSWRLNQTHFPQTWHARGFATPDAPKESVLCVIPYVFDGVVGVDVKSHQNTSPVIPNVAVVSGNHAVDRICDDVRCRSAQNDVHVPTGGLFAFAMLEGRMVTGQVPPVIRSALRDQAAQQWFHRAVQGRLGVISPQAFQFLSF